MAVRSRRFFGPVAVTSTPVVLYTVPAGRTAIFRELTAVVTSPTSSRVTLSVNGVIWWVDTLLTLTAVDLPYLVLNPGDVLRGFTASPVDTVDVTGVGSLLLGAPE